MPDKNPAAIALGSIKTPRKRASGRVNMRHAATFAYQPPDGYITQAEYARRKGVSRSWVHQLVKAGKIEGVLFVGKTGYLPAPNPTPQGEADGI